MSKTLKNPNLFSFIVHGIIGIRLLTLPRELAEVAGSDGWISVLLSVISISFIGYSFYSISLKYPGLNFSQINEKVLGRFPGKGIMIIIAVYTISSFGLGLRYFADSINILLLDRTPRIIIISTMLLLSWYCVGKGIKTISIILDILLPLILLSSAFLILLPINNADIKNLLPVFASGVKPVLKGYLQITDPFLACIAIGYIAPYFINMKETKKCLFAAIAIGMLFKLLLVIMSFAVFGCTELTYLVYPALTLAKSVQLRTQLFERAEGIFMAIWVLNAFTSLVIFYFVSTLNLKTLLNINKENTVNLIQIPIFLLIAIIPKNIAEVFRYLDMTEILIQILNLIYMPLFIIAVFLKSRRRSNECKQ